MARKKFVAIVLFYYNCIGLYRPMDLHGVADDLRGVAVAGDIGLFIVSTFAARPENLNWSSGPGMDGEGVAWVRAVASFQLFLGGQIFLKIFQCHRTIEKLEKTALYSNLTLFIVPFFLSFFFSLFSLLFFLFFLSFFLFPWGDGPPQMTPLGGRERSAAGPESGKHKRVWL